MQAFALEGIHVLDLTQVMAGPFCCMLLADMGADVIKVEKPRGGDDSRRMGPPFINGESAAFMAMNRNKRSVVINLKDPEGRTVFRRLLAWADILVENFRPGAMKALGLGYEDLRKEKPELIYCSISGFGQTGPYSQRGGFDLVTQGMSGLMSITGHPGGPPVKVGVPLTDLNAGMYAAYGILSAYVHRLRTGEGQWVETSLLEAGIAYTVWESSMFFATGKTPPPMGSAHRLAAPYQAFRTADGYLTLGAANQANWEKLCQVLERPDLVEDPRFADNPSRTASAPILAEVLEEVFRQGTTASWLERLAEGGVPAGPLYDIPAVYDDPHVRSREMLVEIDHPVAGRIKNIGIPVKLSGTPGSIRHAAPALGQHTESVLLELGMTQEEVQQLREAGVVGPPEAERPEG